MDSPQLPWELIERIVDMSVGLPNTLCSLALTCRRLRGPSHGAIFERIQLESSEHVFAFVAFLQANPQLRPLVHTVVVTPLAFGPSLLYILPNILSIECVDELQLEESMHGDQYEPNDDEDGDEECCRLTNILSRIPPTRARVQVHRSLVLHHAAFRETWGSHPVTLYAWTPCPSRRPWPSPNFSWPSQLSHISCAKM